MYMLAYFDRTNTAMVLPYVSAETGGRIAVDASSKGFASGIFFIGYMFLQIPAAILAARWSAKKTVSILMVMWGLAAMACSLAQTNTEFYAARFLLGVFEGGVWPSVLVMLASWFPLKERARANQLWMCALPLSSAIISPITGALLHAVSWRIVFLIEGVPPLIWVPIWLLLAADHPRQAKWISPEERTYIEGELAADEVNKPNSGEGAGYLSAFRNGRVWLLISIGFCWMAGFYGYTMWLPTVIKNLTSGSSSLVGWLTAIPYVFAIAAMMIISYLSDKTRNRRYAVAFPALVAAAALIVGQVIHDPVINIILLVVVGMGVYAPYGPFWAIPGGMLRIEILAGALGLINALINVGGFVGPFAVGWLTDATNHASVGYLLLALLLIIQAVLTLIFVRPGRMGSEATS
jgi:MFS family permease